MADISIIKGRQWTSSEEVITLLESLLADAKRGEITALAYAAERPDENFQSGATRLENCFAMGGYMMSMAIRLMGFEDNRNRIPVIDRKD